MGQNAFSRGPGCDVRKEVLGYRPGFKVHCYSMCGGGQLAGGGVLHNVSALDRFSKLECCTARRAPILEKCGVGNTDLVESCPKTWTLLLVLMFAEASVFKKFFQGVVCHARFGKSRTPAVCRWMLLLLHP